MRVKRKVIALCSRLAKLAAVCNAFDWGGQEVSASVKHACHRCAALACLHEVVHVRVDFFTFGNGGCIDSVRACMLVKELESL